MQANTLLKFGNNGSISCWGVEQREKGARFSPSHSLSSSHTCPDDGSHKYSIFMPKLFVPKTWFFHMSTPKIEEKGAKSLPSFFIGSYGNSRQFLSQSKKNKNKSEANPSSTPQIKAISEVPTMQNQPIKKKHLSETIINNQPKFIPQGYGKFYSYLFNRYRRKK